jgi:hypothetical protein
MSATKSRFANVKRATDFVKVPELTKMEAIADQDVLLHTVTPITTDLGAAVRLEVETEDEAKHTLITGGQVIYTKLLELAAMNAAGQIEFPVVVCFTKQGRAWTIA